MDKVYVLQHVSCEPPGSIGDALSKAGIALELVHTFAGQPVPAEMGGAAGLVVMGGPMGVGDNSLYPFLRDELRLIEQALRAGKPVLGVCLGSQMLATVLGAPVTRGGQKEIGWHAVTLTEPAAADPLLSGIPSPFTAYHWHGDVFELPREAVPLASSALTAHQAFRYGQNAYGFLFHMEVTEPLVRGMVETFKEELQAEGIDAAAVLAGAAVHLSRLRSAGDLVFGRWADAVRRGSEPGCLPPEGGVPGEQD